MNSAPSSSDRQDLRSRLRFEWFVARRYFKGKGFLSFIRTMAVGGIAVGSAGLLIALSIAHGFRSVIQEKTLEFAPHLTILAPYSLFPARLDTIPVVLESFPEVSNVQSVLYKDVILQVSGGGNPGTSGVGAGVAGDEGNARGSSVGTSAAGGISGGLAKGVAELDTPHELERFIVDGTFDLGSSGSTGTTDLTKATGTISSGTMSTNEETDSEVSEKIELRAERDLPGMVVGAGLARDLQASVGSIVTAYSIQGIPSPGNLPEIRQFRLNGIYKTGIDRFDDGLAFVSIDQLRKLAMASPTAVSQVEIWIAPEDIDRIPDLQLQMQSALPYPYVVESIYQTYRNLFEWIRLQEETVPLVIAIMVVIAAFNLVGTILMMVLERVRDIGILKTLGMSRSSIRRVFLLEGLLVCVTGLVIGSLIHLSFFVMQTKFGWIKLSEENYYMSVAPVEPHALDFLIVVCLTLFLGLLASLLPANFAAKTDPVKTLVFDR